MKESESGDRGRRVEARSVPVPRNRLKAVEAQWISIYTPVVKECKLQIRMNLAAQAVDLRTCELTEEDDVIQRAEEFLRAVMLGFEVEDALSILRSDSVYVECFEVEDVKTLRNEHLSRAIGRIAGRKGKVKTALENIAQCRIVVADRKVRVMGTVENIRLARGAISRLIMGSQPSKVCTDLRLIANKIRERF
jgi:RNA-binding protein PNO1